MVFKLLGSQMGFKLVWNCTECTKLDNFKAKLVTFGISLAHLKLSLLPGEGENRNASCPMVLPPCFTRGVGSRGQG